MHWPNSAPLRVRPLTLPRTLAMRTRRICSRVSHAPWTSCCGWSKLTRKRRIEIPLRTMKPGHCMKTNSFLGIASLLIGLSLTGCGKHASQPAPPPPTVSVVQPVAREVVEWDEYIGRLESPETVEV